MNPVGPLDSAEDKVMPRIAMKTMPKKVRLSTNIQHHPTYLTMIKRAILALNDTKGASKAAILKYVAQNYQLGENLPVINTHIRNALKKGLDSGEVKQTKGHGASGSFTVAPAHNMKKAKKMTSKTVKTKPMKESKAKVTKKKTSSKTKSSADKEKKSAKKVIKSSTKKTMMKKKGVVAKKKTTLHKKTTKVSKKPKAKIAKKTTKVVKKA